MFKHKNLAKLLTHKYTLYFMYFLALLNGVNYFKKQKIYCALIAIAFFLLSNKFLTKNKALSIFYSLFLANFVLGCGKIIEGACTICYRNMPDAEDCVTKRKACLAAATKASALPNADLGPQFNIKNRLLKKPSFNHNDVRTTGAGAVEAQEASASQARQAQQARGQAQQQPRQAQRGASGQAQGQAQQAQRRAPGQAPALQNSSTHTHNKQVVLITASVVASALALIVASGAIFLVNKKKF